MSEGLFHNGAKHHQLFYLENIGYIRLNPEELKAMIAGAQFVCTECGQAARSKKHLEQEADLQSAPKLWVL